MEALDAKVYKLLSEDFQKQEKEGRKPEWFSPPVRRTSVLNDF